MLSCDKRLVNPRVQRLWGHSMKHHDIDIGPSENATSLWIWITVALYFVDYKNYFVDYLVSHNPTTLRNDPTIFRALDSMQELRLSPWLLLSLVSLVSMKWPCRLRPSVSHWLFWKQFVILLDNVILLFWKQFARPGEVLINPWEQPFRAHSGKHHVSLETFSTLEHPRLPPSSGFVWFILLPSSRRPLVYPQEQPWITNSVTLHAI